MGFEPTVPGKSTHAFQACTFGPSVISPEHGRKCAARRLHCRPEAERVGFEPTEPAYAAQRISSPPDSTALASLRAPASQALPPGLPGLRAQEDSNLRPLDPQSNALSRLSYGHESARHQVAPFRRGWDSNPRYPCEYNSLAGSPIRPLSHLSRPCTAGHTDLRGTCPPPTRRGRDSNPRSFTLNGFQDRLLRPLGHLSEACTLPELPIYRRPPPGCQFPPHGIPRPLRATVVGRVRRGRLAAGSTM